MRYRRMILSALIALVASPALSDGTWNLSSIGPGSCSTFTFGGSDAGDAQPALSVPPGRLFITAEVATGSPSVVLYAMPVPGSDAPSGTALATITATVREPEEVTVGGGYVVDPDVDTDGDGGTITVCASGIARSGLSGQADAALVLDQTGSEIDLRYDSTQNVYHESTDGDATWDQGESSISNSLGNTHSNKKRVCYPEDYDRDGTSTTDGIQECVAVLETNGGGLIQLGQRSYDITGASPLTFNTASAEIILQGVGPGASFINCTTGTGCTASSVIDIRRNYITVRDLHIQADRDATTVDGILAGCAASNTVSQLRIERVQIDGDSGDTAGSRAGVGVKVCSLRSVYEQVDMRWFADGFLFMGTANAAANANVIRSSRATLVDDGIDTSVGNFTANRGDVEGAIRVESSTFETVNAYGIRLRGGSNDQESFNSLVSTGNYFESLDAGIYVDGSASSFDPDVLSIGDKFASTTTDAIVADADTDSDIVVIRSRINDPNCITHSGSGDVLYSAELSTCTPTVASGSRIDLDLAATLTAAQTFATGTKTVTAKFDFGGGTLEIPNSVTLPGTCTVGDLYMDTDATSGQRLYACESTNTWALQGDGGGGGGAPTVADYLVGTANGSLSAEIVVGTSPGGELGGTWASPTIDDSLAVTSWNLTTPTITTSVTFEGGATDPVITPGSGTLSITNLTTLTLPASSQLAITSGCTIDTNIDCPPTASPQILLTDSDNSGEIAISGSDAAGPDAVLAIQADIAGTLTTFAEADGVTERFEILKPLTLPIEATPTTDADGELSVDTDGWGTGFDAIEFFNGTASAYLVATTASDTPTNGQVPKWNTGGSITWENDSTGAGSLGSNLSSTTNDITSNNEAIVLAGTTESLTITYTSNTATITSTTGVTTINHPDGSIPPADLVVGTGVATALGVNVGSAGAFVTNGGALGTPSGGTLTNATGLPIASGVSGLGTGIATALAVNTGSAGSVGVLIASGAEALATAEIASQACSTADTGVTATGVATTDAISWSFNADPVAVTGYAPVTQGGLSIYAYPTSNAVNFKVCNPTAAPITPGAITLNWRVIR